MGIDMWQQQSGNSRKWPRGIIVSLLQVAVLQLLWAAGVPHLVSSGWLPVPSSSFSSPCLRPSTYEYDSE